MMHRKWLVFLAAIVLLCGVGCFKPAWASSVAAGQGFTVAIASDGSLRTWGSNTSGQLGNGQTTQSDTPVSIVTGTTFSSVAAGSNFALAIDSSGALWAWGDNTYGQLGYNTGATAVYNSTPKSLSVVALGPPAGTTWTAVTTGSNFAAAIDSNGLLWTWGSNASGQLGTTAASGSNTSTVLTQVTASGAAQGTTWTAVAAGSDFIVAIRSDNTLWAWGDNTSGQFGNGTTTSKSTPAPVGAVTTWTQIAAGSNFVVALRSDTTGFYTWGGNDHGQLGNNSTGNASSTPQLIEAGTTFSSLTAGSDFALAIDNTGALWAWGDNTSGQFGNNSTTSSSTPVQIPISPTLSSGETWTAVAAGSDFTVAMASDSSIWTWGGNESGQLGDGTVTNRSLPKQIIAAVSSTPSTPPINSQIDSTVPANGAIDVEVDSSITVTFNQAMDPTSLTTSTFFLSPSVAGTISYDPYDLHGDPYPIERPASRLGLYGHAHFRHHGRVGQRLDGLYLDFYDRAQPCPWLLYRDCRLRLLPRPRRGSLAGFQG